MDASRASHGETQGPRVPGDSDPRLLATLEGHTKSVIGVETYKDTGGRERAISFADDGTLRVWDLQTHTPVATLEGHSRLVYGTVVFDQGRRAISCSSDSTLRVWDLDAHAAVATLEGHSGFVFGVAVYDEGRRAISCSEDSTLRIWDLEAHAAVATLEGHAGHVWSVAVYDQGRRAISCSEDSTLRIWDLEAYASVATLEGHTGVVYGVAVYEQGRRAVSSGIDTKLRIWDLESHRPVATLEGHTACVKGVSIYEQGRRAISCSADRTLRVWDLEKHAPVAMLEGHSDMVYNVVVYDDDRRAISCAEDSTLRVWDLQAYSSIGKMSLGSNGTAFDFAQHVAVYQNGLRAVSCLRINSLFVWDLEGLSESVSSLYTNAKVVLVGDSGVGKSGLRLVLEGKKFEPTDSTHGRFVTEFDSRKITLASGRTAVCETLLWDLAGQPGYRLVNQLQLKEVTVALVLFDAKSETDPFAGVHHWDRALRQAQRVQGASSPPLKKFLVAARMDRGGTGVSRRRIEALVDELGFEAYLETSAKTGAGVSELADAVKAAIDWESIPTVSSTELFQGIKRFLICDKETGRILAQEDELLRAFNATGEANAADFATCVNRIQDRGLVRRLSFGNLVLMQPEFIDNYASALINVARDEPQGLGCILEEQALRGEFEIPPEARLPNRDQENLLLIAMVRDLMAHEIALREPAEDGVHLIFPSQLTRENNALPDPPGKDCMFEFDGAVMNVYTTLAVRLSHSSAFEHRELWKNAIVYDYTLGTGACGMFLTELGEGHGRITLFYEDDPPAAARAQFEEFIRAHLLSHEIRAIRHRRFVFCSECRTPVADIVVERIRERGRDELDCPVCGNPISLKPHGEPDAQIRAGLLEMGRSADVARRREEATAIIKGKRATNDYDVFLCHNSADKDAVKGIGEQLKERRILPWLDEWELRPGMPWQDELERQIESIKAAAVFVGKDGIGPWQDRELRAFLSEFLRRKTPAPVIPVLLPTAARHPKLPVFLREMTWVDFRMQKPDPIVQLIWGITGRRDFDPGG
jgi:small GTP-binding protein